jgi:hypothetical protein
MSSKVTFQITKFTNLYPDGTEGDVSYGYRVYDDYGVEYSNILEYQDVINMTPALALENIFSHMQQDWSDPITNSGGFYFGDQWIEVDKDGYL